MLMENDRCVIHEKDGRKNLLAVVQMTKNRMFPLKIETCFSSQVGAAPHTQSALRSVIEDPSRLWHLKYGHLGYAGLNVLSNKRMVEGLPRVGNSCDKCVIQEKDGSKNLLAAVQMSKNRMFPLKIETCFSSQVGVGPPTQSALRSMIEDPSWLCHLRYGHLGYAGLNFLSNKRMV